MNKVRNLLQGLGAWRRRRSTRSLMALSAFLVAAVALAGVALAAGLRSPSAPPSALASASASPAGTPTPIAFEVVSPSAAPTDTPTPTGTPTPTTAPTPTPTSTPTSGPNVMTITSLVPQGIDATVGQKYCFSGPVGRLTVAQPGQSYTTAFSTQTGGAGTNTWQQIPLQMTATGPLTYDLTPSGCVTWMAAQKSGMIYTVFQSPSNSPQASGTIDLRVDNPGAAEVAPTYVQGLPSSLHEKAGVDSGFTELNAEYRDDISAGDEDAYSFSIDFGDGSPTLGGSPGSMGIQGDTIDVTGGFDHTWQSAGTYTLTFTFDDSDGGSVAETVTVTVSA